MIDNSSFCIAPNNDWYLNDHCPQQSLPQIVKPKNSGELTGIKYNEEDKQIEQAAIYCPSAPTNPALSVAHERESTPTNDILTYRYLSKYAVQGVLSGVTMGATYATTSMLAPALIAGSAVGSAATRLAISQGLITESSLPQCSRWATEGLGSSLSVGLTFLTNYFTYHALQRVLK